MPLPINGINYIIKATGESARIRYYTEGLGSVWDDERTLTASGNDYYTSGVFYDLNGAKASDDAVLIEQGRLKYGDSKVLISGGIPTTSGALVFTISKSGTNIVYEEILPGIATAPYSGQSTYKMIYVRELTLGSLT